MSLNSLKFFFFFLLLCCWVLRSTKTGAKIAETFFARLQRPIIAKRTCHLYFRLRIAATEAVFNIYQTTGPTGIKGTGIKIIIPDNSGTSLLLKDRGGCVYYTKQQACCHCCYSWHTKNVSRNWVQNRSSGTFPEMWPLCTSAWKCLDITHRHSQGSTARCSAGKR